MFYLVENCLALFFDKFLMVLPIRDVRDEKIEQYLCQRFNHLSFPDVKTQLPNLLHLFRGVHTEAPVGQLSITANR